MTTIEGSQRTETLTWPLKKGDTIYFKTFPPNQIIVPGEFLAWINKKKRFVWVAECQTQSGHHIHLRDYSMFADLECKMPICRTKENAMPDVNWH